VLAVGLLAGLFRGFWAIRTALPFSDITVALTLGLIEEAPVIPVNFVEDVIVSVTLVPSGRDSTIDELEADVTLPRSITTVTQFPFPFPLTSKVAWSVRSRRVL
jgi:hypothetical protein